MSAGFQSVIQLLWNPITPSSQIEIPTLILAIQVSKCSDYSYTCLIQSERWISTRDPVMMEPHHAIITSRNPDAHIGNPNISTYEK